MSDQTAQPREAVETNWDALTNAYSEKPLVEVKKEEVPLPADEKPAENTEIKIDETVKPESKPTEQESEALKVEAKDLGLPETATKEEIEAAKVAKTDSTPPPVIEFTTEDIKDAIEPEDGTWAAIAKADGLPIDKKFEEYTHEDYKQGLSAKHQEELAQVKSMTKESLFSTLKPETAVNLRLMEMGVSEDKLFEAERNIDKYLALDNAGLIRADKELLGWPVERIDQEIEELTARGSVDHEGLKLRDMLEGSKKNLQNEKQDILKEYESKQEQAILAQKEEEKTHFKKAMNDVSTFMGSPIPTEIKEAVIRKFNSGVYDKYLTTLESKAEYILFRELNQKILKTVQNAASAKGRDEIREKLLVTKPESNNNAGSKQTINQESNDPWAAVDKMAKQAGY